MSPRREKGLDEYVIESLARGLKVLAEFDQDHARLSLTDLVRRTGINKATLFRILSTFESEGYLERDPDTRLYSPGLKVLCLGFAALSNLDLRQVARPQLEQLAASLELTASLSVLDNMHVVYVDRVRNRAIVGVVLGLGSRIPAHCSSMGKAMLAHLPEEDLDARLHQANLTPCTPNSIIDIDQLKADLATIRAEGVAYNVDELFVGLRAVAAPILDRSGRAIAAINVSGTSDVMSVEIMREKLASELKAAAQRISQSQI